MSAALHYLRWGAKSNHQLDLSNIRDGESLGLLTSRTRNREYANTETSLGLILDYLHIALLQRIIPSHQGATYLRKMAVCTT